MKPSELKKPPAAPDQWTLPHPRSDLADPPIALEEARTADTAVCRAHRGTIAHFPGASDTEGKVFFCPVGGQYWRYSKQQTGMYAPLDYGPSDFV